ncbi:MAG: 50S ribosomal protein L4 [Holosporales bacterium]|nr:50S ribosomal protein L4 [Holosporales bacterium]
MKLNIIDKTNQITGELQLSDDVFGLVPRKDIMSRVVLWQLAKRRSGTHSTKGKSTVHGTTRKCVRQKGSGGARHGSKKAVQFRGGGIVFGPVVREHSFSITKKVRKLGLRMALSTKARSGDLVVVDTLQQKTAIKTKEFMGRFGRQAKTALFVDTEKDERILNAISNIVGYDFVPQLGANVYDIIRKEKLIISVEAIKALESRLV